MEGAPHVSHTSRAKHRATVFKRTLAGVSAAAVVGTAVALVGSGAAGAATTNLVANPGFESGLSNWSCSGGSGAAVSSPVHSGASALKATPAGQDDAQCTQNVSVQPNSQYTLSAYVQGSYVYLGATGTGPPATRPPGRRAPRRTPSSASTSPPARTPPP